MWLACLFGEALACSVRVGMQEAAKASELCVCEQNQIAVPQEKPWGNKPGCSNQVLHLRLPSGGAPLGHGGAVGLEEMLAGSPARKAMAKKRGHENRLHSNQGNLVVPPGHEHVGRSWTLCFSGS